MMDHQQELELQAYVDSELTPQARTRVERLLKDSPEARELCDRLRATARLLEANEPAYATPESREFYWSKISRAIERAAPAAASRSGTTWRWWRYLAPFAGAAAVVFAALFADFEGSTIAQETFLQEVESSLDRAEVISFYSHAAGMSVVWVDTRGDY